ncbi:MAG: 16S rRNA (guanine1516-N2)-methyltransferase [Parasphingorhabdus sp.]|jgi:16S rRNA (guanine1516-N2)-methyltransferase
MKSVHDNLVSIVIGNEPEQEFLRQLAQHCGLAINVNARNKLMMREGILQLVSSGQSNIRPLAVDFSRKRRGISRKDLISRAIGRSSRTVIDATAGLGKDSIHLASLGYQVTCVERCPAIAALLLDAKRRLGEESNKYLDVVFGDGCETLLKLKADTVYLDPMFPPSGKSAIPRQTLRTIRSLAGDDLDVMQLFEVAQQRFHRVVVKRPDRMKPLQEPIHHRVQGRTVNYDVYINNHLEQSDDSTD